MDAYFIKNKKRTIATFYIFSQFYSEIIDKKIYINTLVRGIKDSEIGYAGFKTKKFFKEYLEKAIFGSENIKKNKHLSWGQIFTLMPRQILKDAGYKFFHQGFCSFTFLLI